MYRIFFILLDIIVVAIFTVPIGFFLQHFFTERTKKRKLIFILFSLYLIAVFSAVGIPDIRSLVFDPSLNIIPIIDITNSPISYIRNELLNILLFVPLGIFLPVIWSQDLFTLKRTVVFGLGLSFLIEVSQLFTFRLTDIDDIITNVLGTALGYYLLLYCKKHCNIKTDIVDGKISARVELFVLFFYTTLIMFFVKPYIR